MVSDPFNDDVHIVLLFDVVAPDTSNDNVHVDIVAPDTLNDDVHVVLLFKLFTYNDVFKL